MVINLPSYTATDEVMGNKNRKQAKEPIEKTFSNDKLGSIVRKERHKAGMAGPFFFDTNRSCCRVGGN